MSFTKEQLELYIQQGEGYNLEFKESYSANIAKEICAFANANGGKILLGVNDNGKVTGINITNRLKSQIQDIGRNMDPPVNFLITVMDNIVIIDVPGGSNKPYSTNGKFYLRYGSNSQQLRRNEIITFFQKEGVVRFDEKMNYDFNLKKDLSSEKFNRFLKMSGISIVLETETILKNLELVKDSNIRNAGVLFFCEKVTRFFLNATITCVLFQGKDKYKILDRKEFESDIFSNYLDALNYLRSKLNTEYIIKGGPREEKLELPEEALREAILNAIAHRNYFLNSNIQIYIFSDRVEITNPGGLPAGMSYSDLGKKSMPRNFLLFGLMQRMNLVEKIGSGILRIKNAIEEYKLEEPLIEVNENWFTIIFKRPELQKESFEGRKEMATQKTTQKTTQKILELVEKEPHITRKELAHFIGISENGIKYHLAKLKEKGSLKRIGPDKGGYWQVKK